MQLFFKDLKAGTHEGACSCSTLLKHAPGAKLPRLHQRFLAKKYVAQKNFCSRVLLPHIKLVWYEGASSRGKTVARFCFRSKLSRVYLNLLCGSVFQEQAPPSVLKFALRERVSGASFFVYTGWSTYPGACFGSVFQEQAPSCVPALKQRRANWPNSTNILRGNFNLFQLQTVKLSQVASKDSPKKLTPGCHIESRAKVSFL